MIRRILVVFLIFLLVNLYLPRVASAQVGEIEEITHNAPAVRSTPAEDIPVETAKKSKLWLWALIGAVAVGAIAAVAAGGGGGGGGGSSSSTSSSSASKTGTGSVSVAW